MGTFLCPRCRLAFRSRPLLRVHMEKLCLGPTAPSSSCLHGGDPLPVEGAQSTARKPQDISVGMSQNTDDAEARHHSVPRGVPAAVRGQQGPGRARGAPLGDVLTPRERALLRTADPPSRRVPVEGEPPRQPPQELLEAHERQVAEIRARTRQLELQREGLCRRLAALGAGAPLGPQPEHGEPKPSQGLQDQARQVPTAQHRATLHLDTLLPPAGPLAAEARALQVSYLRSGGHDPAILDQLLHLQLEATVLEKGTAGLRRARRMEPPGTGTHGLDAALLAVELENRRLEDELLALKVRRERRVDAGVPRASTGAWQTYSPRAPRTPPHPLCGPGGPSSCSGAPSTRQSSPKVSQDQAMAPGLPCHPLHQQTGAPGTAGMGGMVQDHCWDQRGSGHCSRKRTGKAPSQQQTE